MRVMPFLMAVLTLLAFHAKAQPPVSFPPGAEARETQLMMKIGPRTRAWISQEAQREAALPETSEAIAANAVHSNPGLSSLRGSDITAVTFLIMMEVAKSAGEDLKAIQEGVNTINREKEAQRAALQTAKREKLQIGSKRGGNGFAPLSPARVDSVAARPKVINRASIQPRPLPRAAFQSNLASARNSPDALNEMGETESLRLQMAMDRYSKMMSTLSNVMKKMSDTSSSIAQNLK